MIVEREWPDPGEAVEIRTGNSRMGREYKIVAWRTAEGTVNHYMTALTGGETPESLSNLQPKLPFPGKAVVGWQAEFVEAAGSGLYEVTEVR